MSLKFDRKGDEGMRKEGREGGLRKEGREGGRRKKEGSKGGDIKRSVLPALSSALRHNQISGIQWREFLSSIQTIACALQFNQFRLSSAAKNDELFVDPQLHSASHDHNSVHLCATQRCGADSCVGIHVFRCLGLLFFPF